MKLNIESETRYCDAPMKARLVALGFVPTGKHKVVYEMRHAIQTKEFASLEELEAFVEAFGEVTLSYGTLTLSQSMVEGG